MINNTISGELTVDDLLRSAGYSTQENQEEKRRKIFDLINDYTSSLEGQQYQDAKLVIQRFQLRDFFVDLPSKISLSVIKDEDIRDHIAVYLGVLIDFLTLPRVSDTFEQQYGKEAHAYRRRFIRLLEELYKRHYKSEATAEVLDAMRNKNKANALSLVIYAFTMVKEEFIEYLLPIQYKLTRQEIKIVGKISQLADTLPSIDEYRNLGNNLSDSPTREETDAVNEQKEQIIGEFTSAAARVLGLIVSLLELIKESHGSI